MHGLEREHKGIVKTVIENATSPENKTRILNEFGFKSHGLVIYDGAGTLQQRLDGHYLKEPEIRTALEAVLAAAAEPAAQPVPGG